MAESDTPTSVVVLHEGCLTKSSPLKKTLVTWNKRWFVLEEHKEGDDIKILLAYYKDDKKTTRKGQIVLDRSCKFSTDVRRRGKKHLFSVYTKSRTYLLSTESNAQLKTWLAKLREAGGLEHVCHVVPTDKLPRHDALLRFDRLFLEVFCPVTDQTLGRWNVGKISSMGCMGPMFWINLCPDCASQGEMTGLLFFTVQRGPHVTLQLLRQGQLAAQTCGPEPVCEQINDMNVTLHLPGHFRCRSMHSQSTLTRSTSSVQDFHRVPSSVAHAYGQTSQKRTLLRYTSSPQLFGSSDQLAGMGLQNQRTAALAHAQSRLRSATTTALTAPYVNMSLGSANSTPVSCVTPVSTVSPSPLIRVPYEASSCLTLPSPKRLNSGRERLSVRSRSSNPNTWSRGSTDSGVCSYYGHQLDTFLHEGGSLPRILRRRSPPKDSSASSSVTNDDDRQGYEVMGPLSEEGTSSSSDSETSKTRKASPNPSSTLVRGCLLRNSFSARPTQGSFHYKTGYVNLELLPDADGHSS